MYIGLPDITDYLDILGFTGFLGIIDFTEITVFIGSPGYPVLIVFIGFTVFIVIKLYLIGFLDNPGITEITGLIVNLDYLDILVHQQ